MKKLIMLLPLLLLPLILSTCYFPPYREELSLAVGTTKKMEGVAFVGPLDRGPWDFEGREITFYPSKDALLIRSNDYVKGYIVAVDERSVRLMYVNHGPLADDDYYTEFDDTFPLDNTDETRFSYTATTAKDGSDIDPRELFATVVFESDSGFAQYIMFDETHNIIPGPEPIPLDFGLFALGASFYPEDFPAFTWDWLHILLVDPLTGRYTEQEWQTDAINGLNFMGDIRFDFALPGLPDDISNCFYFNSPLPPRRSYLSYYDSVRRAYRNFSWDDAQQLQILSNMERRIDLLLSNGWLFSRDGNTAYVYDSDGELLNSFVMGGLQLVYEVLDAGFPRTVFTIPIWAPVDTGDGHWDDRLHFLVYWVPTDQLADL